MGWLASLAEHLPLSARRPECPVFVSFEPSRGGVLRYPALSRSKFIARLKLAVQSVLGFSPALYAGYSLRRGGVTEMLSQNVPLPIVKRHVGWSATSDAPMAYYDHHGRLQMRIPTQVMGQRARV